MDLEFVLAGRGAWASFPMVTSCCLSLWCNAGPYHNSVRFVDWFPKSPQKITVGQIYFHFYEVDCENYYFIALHDFENVEG